MKRLDRALEVGPKYSAELERCGVRSLQDLANTRDVPGLSASSGVPLEQLQQWHQQAQRRVKISRYRRNIAIGIAVVVAAVVAWEIRAFERSPVRLYSRAYDLVEQHKYEEAIQIFVEVVSIDPKYELAYENLAYSLHQLGRNSDALNAINRALALNPTHTWSLDERGSIYNDMDKYDLAVADFDKSIELNPKGRFAHAHRGMALRMLHRYPEALDSLNQAIELKDDYMWAYNERGNVYSDSGQPEKAIADYKKAIELDPTYKYPYSEGYDLRKLGRYQEAVEALTKGISLDPKWDWAYEARGLVYHDNLYQYENAYQDMKKVCELKTCEAYDLEDVGEAAFTADHFKESFDMFSKILADHEKDSVKDFDASNRLTARFYIIASLLMQGDIAGAKTSLDEFAAYYASLDPKFKRHWIYDGTKRYVAGKQIDPATKTVLLTLMKLLDEKPTATLAQVQQAAAQLK